uniref:SNF2 N-terminal domain-containing protein n=1 Tax=Tetranychus urticae TaxID=32264 RepID=T1KAX4_TETUR
MVNGLSHIDCVKASLVKKHIHPAIAEQFGDNKLHKIDTDTEVFQRILIIIHKKYESKSKNRRRNIQKVFTDQELLEETIVAGKKEEKRKQRILNKRQIFDRINVDKSRLILEFDLDTHEPIVEVAPVLAKKMKSQQIEGIRFMWDSAIESVYKAKEDGPGCILAHSIGLGKTFQIITFLHTILAHLNTIKNWIAEFRQWLEDNGLLEFHLFDLSDSKQQLQRGETFKLWK